LENTHKRTSCHYLCGRIFVVQANRESKQVNGNHKIADLTLIERKYPRVLQKKASRKDGFRGVENYEEVIRVK
jgi:hypothetical protein